MRHNQIKTIHISELFLLLLIPSIPYAQDYRFLPERRVNKDAIGTVRRLPGFTNAHSIIARRDSVFIVWQGNQESGYYHIYFSKSDNRGDSFHFPIRLDTRPGTYNAYEPALAEDKRGTIYCAFRDSSSGSQHIYIVRSTDGGASFNRPVQVDFNGGSNPQFPSLAVDQYGFLYCTWGAWRDSSSSYSNIYISKSTDGGITFSSAVMVDSTDSLRMGISSIDTDSSRNVYICWRDNRMGGTRMQYHVYFSKSTDGGKSFSVPLLVDSTEGNYTATFPSLTVDRQGVNVYCLYKDRSSGRHHVYLSRSTDGGNSFFGHLQVDTTGSQTADNPNIFYRDIKKLFCIWGDTRLGPFLTPYFSYSKNGGLSFSDNIRVSTQTTGSYTYYTHVYADSQEIVYCTWAGGTGGAYDIYFAKGVPYVGIEEREMSSISVIKLHEIVPNPTWGPVRIHFTLSRLMWVEIVVYDITGRKMATLIEGEKDSGIHSYLWNANVPSGIYFIHFTAEGKSSIKRLLVMR